MGSSRRDNIEISDREEVVGILMDFGADPDAWMPDISPNDLGRT
jgi:hypothetical protein